MDLFYPIQLFADLVTYKIFGILPKSYLGNAVNFFIYDTLKIGVLLVLINFVMAATRYFFPMERVRDILTKRRWFGLDYLLAALLGVVTPFCSCSSIPLFIGFLGAGIPLGVTFSFLISSPLVNESSLYLFPAIFGLKTTIIYNLSGILVAVLGGMIIQKMNLQDQVRQEFLKFNKKQNFNDGTEKKSEHLKKLLKHFWIESAEITKKIFPFVTLGVFIGALIHGFVPQELITKYLSARAFWAVPLATLLGAPLYANSVSVIPIMEALVEKGVPLGTSLAFMTGVVTLSLPEILILKTVMKWKLLAIFMGITVLGIILIGWEFNLIL